jgi:AraC-like DNA-binding protein
MNKLPPLERNDPSGESGWTPHKQRVETLLETKEIDRVEFFLKELAQDPFLNLKFDGARHLDMLARGFSLSKLRILMMQFGAPMTTHGDVPVPDWVFVYLRRGTAILERTGTRFGPGDAGVCAPNQDLNSYMTSDASALSLTVTKAEMTHALMALNGPDFSGTPNFHERCPSGSSAALALLRVINKMSATPVYQQLTAERLERSLKEAALFELLLAWPQQESREAVPRIELPKSTRLARDFMEARIAELPTVADVAAACGVGVRALARGFEKHLGTSPLQYMLELRLQGVHDELLVGSQNATVTDVALHWGFTHLGIFAARYRERFGELPSETLRTARL